MSETSTAESRAPLAWMILLPLGLLLLPASSLLIGWLTTERKTEADLPPGIYLTFSHNTVVRPPDPEKQAAVDALIGLGARFNENMTSVPTRMTRSPLFWADGTNINEQVMWRSGGLFWWSTTVDGLKNAAVLPELQRLNLAGDGLTDESIESLAKVRNVREVELIHGPFTPKVFAYLGGAPELKHVRLQPNTTDATVTAEDVAPLEGHKNLARLEMHNWRVTDGALEVLSTLPKLQTLESHGQDITDDGLLSLANVESLRELQLYGTKATDRSLEALSQLDKLTVLDVSGSGMTDRGAEHLLKLKRLKSLSLSGSQLSDAGLMSLVELRALRQLDVFGTKVTEQGVAEFKQARPGVEVGWQAR